MYWFVFTRMEKKEILFFSIKKSFKQILKTAAFYCSQFMVKFLKEWFSMKHLVFLLENILVLLNQSSVNLGFLALISYYLLHTKSFNEVGSISLDISKGFDEVSRKVLISKLSQNGISGNYLDILSDFLSHRKQRVVCNCQKSSWEENFQGRLSWSFHSGTIVVFNLYKWFIWWLIF